MPSTALLRAAHPVAAVLTALGAAAAADLWDRPPREVALVGLTVLVGQGAVGLDAALADRRVAERGNARFALACLVLLVVPLSVASGTEAGLAHLGALLVTALGSRLLRRTPLSFLPWAAAYALLAAFVVLGGWNGTGSGSEPEPALLTAAALLGVGVHVLAEAFEGLREPRGRWRSLPRLLVDHRGLLRVTLAAAAWSAACVAALVVTGQPDGLG